MITDSNNAERSPLESEMDINTLFCNGIPLTIAYYIDSDPEAVWFADTWCSHMGVSVTSTLIPPEMP